MTAPAAYSLYELLRVLVERAGWPTEEEKRAALRSVSEAERMGILGNLAVAMVCDHPAEAIAGGRCEACGRQVEQPAVAWNPWAIRRGTAGNPWAGR